MRLNFKLSLFYFISLLIFLNLPQLGGSSEAREAHVISVILSENEWILPTRNGLIPSKPPLFHWIAASLSKLPGLNLLSLDFMARLPSAILAALTLLLCLNIVKIFQHQTNRMNDDDNGRLALSALILISTYGFTSMAMRSMVDMTFCFLNTLCSYIIIRKINLNSRDNIFSLNSRDYLLFFITAALAVLCKGPLGIALPGLTLCICAFNFKSSESPFSVIFRPRVAWLLFILVAIPWYLLAIDKGGNAFIDRQFMLENLERFFGEETKKPFWFYIPAFITQALPWSLILIISLLPFKIPSLKEPDYKRFNFLLWIMAATLLFFSISSGKRASYLLPIYPLLAVWLGLCLNKQLFSAIFKFNKYIYHATLLIWTLIAVIYFFIDFNSDFSPYLTKAAEALSPHSYKVYTLAIFSLILFLRKKDLAVTAFTLFTAAICLIQSGAAYKWQIKGYKQTAENIIQITKREKIALIKTPKDEFFDSLLYYLRRPVQLIEPGAKIAEDSSYIISKQSYIKVNSHLHKSLKEVATFSNDSGLKKNSDKEEMVLLRNYP